MGDLLIVAGTIVGLLLIGLGLSRHRCPGESKPPQGVLFTSSERRCTVCGRPTIRATSLCEKCAEGEVWRNGRTW